MEAVSSPEVTFVTGEQRHSQSGVEDSNRRRGESWTVRVRVGKDLRGGEVLRLHIENQGPERAGRRPNSTQLVRATGDLKSSLNF